MIDASTNIASSKQREIEQFLYREAFYLDSHRYRDWFKLLAEDIRYRIPTIETVYGQVDRYKEDRPYSMYVDHDKIFIEMRLIQLETGISHSETPASVTQRIVSNVLVEATDSKNEVTAYSNLQVTQVRHGDMETFWRARREDRVRYVDDQWLLAERKVILLNDVLPRPLGIFL